MAVTYQHDWVLCHVRKATDHHPWCQPLYSLGVAATCCSSSFAPAADRPAPLTSPKAKTQVSAPSTRRNLRAAARAAQCSSFNGAITPEGTVGI